MSRIFLFMSAAGVLNGIYSRLVKEVEKAGGTGDDIHCLTTPAADIIWPKIAEMIVGIVRPTYKVIVDRTKTLAEMISAGKYGWVNENIIQEHFPIVGSGKQERELVLFHFNRVISSDDAIREMDAAGYQPATIEELLALGEAHPELQRQFPIVALGSVWRDSDGDRRVPCLSWDDVARDLFLNYSGSDWSEFFRFLARRK